MDNEFSYYHRARLATDKKPWSEEMKKTYISVDSAREKMSNLIGFLEEHLRNKWSQDSPNYKEQQGYQDEIRQIRKLKKLEEDLYKTLYEVRKF